MNIGMKLRPEFEKLYEYYAKDPKLCKLLEMDGIAPNQLDPGQCSYDFFNKKLADVATDSNSNAVEDISPASYRAFIVNNQMKLLGYHMVWHYAEKRYGREFADKAIEMIWNGTLYYHDAHGVKIQMPYCYAFSLGSLVAEGRPYGPSPNTPPKHRKAFLSQVDKLIGDLSKQFAGATAPSDFFLWYAYFLRKDYPTATVNELKDEIIQDMQGIVCLFNDGSRAEGEPPFTNLGIYDETGLVNLFGHMIYPDGSKPNLEYIMEIQKVFVEWFKNGDPISGFPYRFPVVTVNLTTDKNYDFINEQFAKWTAKIDTNKGNFNIHFGDKAKLAMCCYSQDTEVLTHDGWKLFKNLDNSELFATVNIDTNDIEYQKATHHHKYKYTGMMHHYYDDKRMFDMMVTPNHEMLCVGGTGIDKRDKWKFVKSEDFGISQALIRRNKLYNGKCDDFGKLVGFYTGDGYYDTNRHIVSFNLKKDRKIEYLLTILKSLNVSYKVGNRDGNGMVRIDILDNTLLNVAYEMGKAKDKYIPYNIYRTPIDVIAGTLDGLMNSDGNWDSNRYWTISERLRDDVMHMACILGYQPWYTQFDRDVELRGKQYHNGTYEIKLLTVEMLTHAKSRRTDVEYDDMVYCVEVPNRTIFVRRNGIATLSSNCRYENDLDDMGLTPDSFGNGGVNIGSHRVITPNIPRAALMSKGDPKKFYTLLDDWFDVAAKLLISHRYDILQHRIDKNPDYLKFYGSLKWFDLKTMFSTFGITGIHEATEFMGYDIMDDEGTDFSLDMLQYIKGISKKYRKEYGVTFNVEEIPGEQACVSLAQKDRLLIDPKMPYEFYSNQYIPLTMPCDLLSKIDISGRFMKMVSGGGIVHLNIDHQIDNPGKTYELIRLSAKSGINHVAICYRFGKCKNGHTNIVGNFADKCPVCGAPIVKNRARVIGYFSDEDNWHPVRQKYDKRYYTDMKDGGEEE